MEEKTVGNVKEVQAIDFTKIYYVTLSKSIRAGQTIRIDTESSLAKLVENTSNTK